MKTVITDKAGTIITLEDSHPERDGSDILTVYDGPGNVKFQILLDFVEKLEYWPTL